MTVSYVCLHVSLQDSDDEANDDEDTFEKPPVKKEFSHRSPSPPAEDSEPEMTEEEKEFQLVCAVEIFFPLLLHVAYRVWFLQQNISIHSSMYSFWMFIFLDDHHKNPSDGDPFGGY